MSNRFIFAGTPDFAATHLQALIDSGNTPIAVYTQPDRPSGRGHKLTPSPVKVLAQKYDIEVFQPENFKAEQDVATFVNLNADLAIVVAYGVILPQSIIDAPRLGCINVHGSLLPKYRGAAPIQRALLDGLNETGVTIMKIVKKLDAGDMLYKATLPISATDTSGSLFEKLATLGAKTLVDILPSLLEGKLKAIPQDENEVTFAAKITKEEAKLDFSLTQRELDLKIRGLNPWPKAYFEHEGVAYKVLEAKMGQQSGEFGTILSHQDGLEIATSDKSIILTIIQAPGKVPVKAQDYLRSKGELFKIGSKL